MGSRPAAEEVQPADAKPESQPGRKKAGGPPSSYERAFRQWSSPPAEELPNSAGELSFAVYTAQDIGAGRGPRRTIPPPTTEEKAKPLVRYGLIALAGVIFFLTLAAVIAVSTDDPKPATPAPTLTAPPPVTTFAPPPEPTTITIGDPPASDPNPISTVPSSRTNISNRPRAPRAPAPSVKGATPPPNPYGRE
jgi:hypothetical protein